VTNPPPSEPESRILRFRPRGSLFARNPPHQPPVEDIAKYERQPDQPDDYRHRMKMNGLAVLATLVLIGTGLWIADNMARLRKNQDCVLAGRPNCAQVQVPMQSPVQSR
jgi:hypothetical protein